VFASNYPLADVFVSTLYIVFFIVWLMLLFHVYADIFRSHDLTGGGKAAWVVFIIVVPYLGALVYVLVRGGSMHERDVQAAATQQKNFEDYIRRVANTKE
jgi:hypothetical protein